MTMRQAVVSFECGTGRRRVAKRRKGRAQPQVAAKAAGEEKQAKSKGSAKKGTAQKAAASAAGKAQQ
jgi:hypothetical protein